MNIKRFERYSCIFFVMIGFVAAYIIGYKIGSEEESNVILRNEIESEMPYISKEYVSEESKSVDASNDDSFLKDSAMLIIETIKKDGNENNENVETTKIKLPVEMIGLDRDGVVKYLEENSDYFKEKAEEIDSIILVSYSPEQVVIRKNVHDGQVVIYTNGDSEKYNYYISFENDKVMVYKKDKSTVFIETGITFDMLDRDTRDSISEGVWIENISVLYRYLESITS